MRYTFTLIGCLGLFVFVHANNSHLNKKTSPSPSLSNNLMECDDFETYSLGDFTSQTSDWVVTGSADAEVSNVDFNSGQQSLLFKGTSNVPDIAKLLGEENGGAYHLYWNMKVVGSRALYQVDHSESLDNLAFKVEFISGIGTLDVAQSLPSNDINYKAHQSVQFQYPQNEWFEVFHFIDLDNNEISLSVNGQLVANWPFSLGENFIQNQLGALNIQAPNHAYLFYIDDLCFLPANCDFSGDDPVCANGISFQNADEAFCHGVSEISSGICEPCDFATRMCCQQFMSSSTFFEDNSYNLFGCGGDLPGRDKLFEIVIPEEDIVEGNTVAFTAFITTDPPEALDDFEILLLNDCNDFEAVDCGSLIFGPNNRKELSVNLTQGTHYILVDSRNESLAANFDLSVVWVCNAQPNFEEALPIECGQNISGTTDFETNNFDRTIYTNNESSNLDIESQYDGMDIVYTISSSNLDLSIELSQLSENLDLFVLQSVGENINLIDYSDNPNLENETLTIPGANGTYYIVVDGSLCTAYGDFNLSIECVCQTSLELTADMNSICSESTTSLLASMSSGAAPFDFQWSNGENDLGNTFGEHTIEVGPGTYIVTVTDFNGCEEIESFTISELSLPFVGGSIQNTTCNLDNGALSLVINGGEPDYSIQWADGPTELSRNNLAAGLYELTVTDANGCQTQSEFVVGGSEALNATLNPIDPTCEQNNGVIETIIETGAFPFSYQWSNESSDPSISGLAPNTYTVTITDADQCMAVESIILTNQSSPIVELSPQNATCEQSNGSISLDIQEGTGTAPFNFEWSNESNAPSLNNLAPNIYSVTVTDANMCSGIAEVPIENIASPTAEATPNDATCELPNGSITLTVNGGTAPFTYLWSNESEEQNQSGLAPDTYAVTITDANQCTTSSSASISNIASPTLMLSENNTTCGQNNGSINLEIQGGTAPFDILWSNESTEQNISNLSTGAYSVTVTDANMCAVTQSASISDEGAPAVNSTVNNETCENANGSIAISVEGGSPPYTFAWSNESTEQNISALTAGTYSVTVTDGNECATVLNATVENEATPLPVFAPENATCEQNNGTINLSIQEGTGTAPFFFFWSNESEEQNQSGLAPDTYTVTITDGNNCMNTGSISINNESSPSVNLQAANATCEQENGAINLEIAAETGTAPFIYAWSNDSQEEDLSNLVPNSYTVTVTDTNGCTDIQTAVVENESSPSISLTPSDATCEQNNGTVISEILAETGTAPFTYSWSNGSGESSISGLSPANYGVTVTDSNGCTDTAETSIENQSSPIISTAGINATCEQNNGAVNLELEVGTGTAPFNFEWSNESTEQNIADITPGNYSVTVTDANNCMAISSTIIINESSPSVILNSDNATCEQQNGTIELNIQEGTGTAPFSFEWSNESTSQNQVNLAPGVYSVTVSDANNCSDVEQVTVANESSPSLISETTNATCEQNNGAINVVITEGTGTAPFSYQWSNGSTESAISNLGPANYGVTVTDVNGCIAINVSTIDNEASPILTANPTNATCEQSNGGATLIIENGTMPFSFAWSNGSTNQNLAEVPAGDYTVTITDANMCQSTGTASIANESSPIVVAIGQNATCEQNNGSISLQFVENTGTAPFEFLWSNEASSQNIEQLSPAMYAVTVLDANECMAEANATIENESSPVISLTTENATCEASNGSVNLTIEENSGTMPFEFLWSNDSTSQNINALLEGSYSVTITDANGCTDTDMADVINEASPVISLSPTNTTCGQSNGAVVLNIEEGTGTGPFSFDWSNGNTSQNIDNLNPDNYSVTVTDANNCMVVASTGISDEGAPSLALEAVNETCSAANGSVAASLEGGTPPFTFLWSNESTEDNIQNLSAGTYSLTITDGNGCNSVQETILINEVAPSVVPISQNATCEENNGAINLQIENGTVPFNFVWSNEATSQNIEGLAPNEYSVTVTDANECQTISSAVIDNEASPVVSLTPENATCEAANGLINLSINEGTGTMPFEFLWSNDSTSQNLNNLTPEAYTVTVTDANGCIGTQSANIANEASPTIIPTANDATCEQNNGTINIEIENGTAPFVFSWSNGSNNQNIGALSPGDYTLILTDTNECVDSSTVTIANQESPTAIPSPLNATCEQNNGIISLAIEGGTAPLTFNWSNGSTNQNLSELNPDEYTVTVTDANECTAVASTIVNNEPSPIINLTPENATCETSNGAINLTITTETGTAPFNFLWSNDSTSQNIDNLLPGNYSVTVVDANECIAENNISIDNEPSPQINLSASSATCGESNGAINVEVTEGTGTAPLNFSWSNGSTLQNLSNLSPEIYSVTVTDDNGCMDTAQTVIEDEGAPVLALSTTNETCSDANGAVSLDVEGGTAPLEFQWSIDMNTQSINNLTAGTYSVTVTDANDCSSVQDTFIVNEAEPVLVPTFQNATCEQNNGAIELEIESGTPPISVLWSNESTSQNLDDLEPNEYIVTVTDGNECVVTENVVIINEASPVVSLDSISSTCGDANGAVNLSIEEGTGTAPFEYIWSNDSTAQNLIDVVADNYLVTVTDANNCETIGSIAVTDEGAPVVMLNTSNETCTNVNGIINLVIEEGTGTPPFDFLWSNESTNQNLENLAADTYLVTVTDTNDCETVQQTTVEDEAAPILSTSVVDATCSNSEGQVTLDIEGGTPPFDFDWSNGAMTQNLNGVPVGEYSVLVTDANDCMANIAAMVNDMGSTVAIEMEFIESSGNQSNDGIVCAEETVTINADVSGGDGNFAFSWDNDLPPTQAQTFNLNETSSFSVTVTDGDGCTAFNMATITVDALPIPELDSNSPVCAEGDLNLEIAGGVAFQWSGPDNFGSTSSNPMINNVDESAAGTYIVVVTDGNNCSASATTEVHVLTEALFPAQPEISSEFICEGSEQLTLFGNTYPDFGVGGMWFAENSGEPLMGDTVVVTELNYGLNTFTYELNGDNCELGTASVEVWLEQPPIAVDDVVRTGENVPIRNLDILANDNVFIDGQPNLMEWDFRVNSADRMEVIINADNTIDIIPDESFFGAVEITYQLISENCSPPSLGTIQLTVTPTPEEEECIFDVQQEDIWNPCFDIPEQNEMIIMNRYGKVVFVTKNYSPDNGWDGSFPVQDASGIIERKLKAPIGTYYFILKDKRENGEDVITTGAILVLR